MNFVTQKTSAKTKLFGYIIAKKNKTNLFIAMGLVLLIACASVFAYYFRLKKIEGLASEKLSSVYAALDKGDQSLATSLLDETIKKFPKTSGACHARLVKADMLAESHAYDDALSILNETLNVGKPDVIKPLASARIIYVYDLKKDYPNTIIASKKFIDKYPKHFLIEDIYLNLAESYLTSGSKEDALKTFNEILVKFPATKDAQKVQDRINKIK
jgi:predicted negative regulator of RcsB-dependent stress response